MRKWERRIVYAGLLLGSLVVVRQASLHRALAGEYEELVDRLRYPHPGYSVPTFETHTLDGKAITIGETRSPESLQLLLVFDTQCPFSLASLPMWKEIASATRREATDLTVLGLALDQSGPVRQYRDDHGLEFPIATFPQVKLKRLYRATTVPLVMLLNAEGRVLYSRLGVLQDSVAADSVLAAVQAARKAMDGEAAEMQSRRVE